MQQDLRPLLATDAERHFFDLYVEVCRQTYGWGDDVWDAPALIPQVWVNWIHFDSRSKERAQRAQEEPFRVDFALRTKHTGEFVIIEIDGSSHFGGRSFVGHDGGMMFEASMEAYTKHLRKDRWLRKQGWRVVRLSNMEIDDVENTTQFRSLLAEILGLPSFGRH